MNSEIEENQIEQVVITKTDISASSNPSDKDWHGIYTMQSI